MKVVTWNIKHGGGDRIGKILSVIEEQKDSDIFILTEFRNNKYRAKIENKFIDAGFNHFANTESDKKLNSVFIAAKKPMIYSTFENLIEHKQRVIKINYESLKIYACYFPNKNQKK